MLDSVRNYFDPAGKVYSPGDWYEMTQDPKRPAHQISEKHAPKMIQLLARRKFEVDAESGEVIDVGEKRLSDIYQELFALKITTCAKQHEYNKGIIRDCQNRVNNVVCGHTDAFSSSVFESIDVKIATCLEALRIKGCLDKESLSDFQKKYAARKSWNIYIDLLGQKYAGRKFFQTKNIRVHQSVNATGEAVPAWHSDSDGVDCFDVHVDDLLPVIRRLEKQNGDLVMQQVIEPLLLELKQAMAKEDGPKNPGRVLIEFGRRVKAAAR